MGNTKVKRIFNQDISGTTKPKLRVCAYCRVSSKSEEQLTSYETQVAVYTEKISSEPGWEFVGIYADRGTSATMMARRKEFLRMLEDCEKGLIDCVICKSLSRFARNTLDALNCIKKLRDLGVRLILEKEGIDTDMISSEILLSVFAAFAQEESHSHSENVRWGKRKRLQNGEPLLIRCYGYRKNEARLIQAHDDWDFAGVYSDEKSGVKASNRPGFQRLIKDALNGKVDYILVKSISRFSRNIVDCQKYANLLHGNGVDIHFDKENLDTAEPSCSMMFSFLSAIAQDESRSISENVRWGYRERFKRGEYNLGNNRILGYDCVDGKLVPNQDADAVRMIFQMYIEGKSVEEIRRLLTDYGIRTKKGQPLAHNNIMYILQNETYMGDKLLQKQPPKNFLTKKPDERAPYESNYLENDHEAIVDRKTWDTVQEIIRQKKAVTAAVGRIGGRPHFLYGKLYCGECGEPMTRRTLNGPKGIKHKVWTCRGRHEGRKGNGCKLRTIKEDLLLQTIEESIGCEVNAENAAQIQRVVITEDDIAVETS